MWLCPGLQNFLKDLFPINRLVDLHTLGDKYQRCKTSYSNPGPNNHWSWFLRSRDRKVDSGKVLLSVAKILWFCLFRICYTVNNFSSEKGSACVDHWWNVKAWPCIFTNSYFYFWMWGVVFFPFCTLPYPNYYKQASASIPSLYLFQWPFFGYFGRDLIYSVVAPSRWKKLSVQYVDC